MSNEDDEFGINDEPEAPSPLIPRRRSGSETLAAPAQPVIEPTLAVIDGIASWKGRPVVLNEADVRSVKAVVLKAIQRELNADMAGLVKRRDRKPKESVSSPAKPQRARRAKP